MIKIIYLEGNVIQYIELILNLFGELSTKYKRRLNQFDIMSLIFFELLAKNLFNEVVTN